MRSPINKNVSIHILVWGLLTALPFIFFANPANHYSIGVIPGTLALIMGMIHITLFYTQALWLYPRFFNRRYWWLYVILALVVVCVSLWLKIWITTTWYPGTMKKPKETFGLIFGGSIDIYAISLLYSRIRYNIRQERRQKELEASQLATELKFLRSQISPHFLFNVLTNMVSLARKKSDQLESALITLAELMRYMLYDTQGKKMPLSTEIRYLNSYIELQKLRFGHDVSVETSIDAGPADNAFVIEPMLLIPFVENAFKHGVGAVDQPRIIVRLDLKDGWMHFEVRNTYDETMSAGREENSGLGLNNVRTRLKLLYPDDHTLIVQQQQQWFQIVLTLKLI